jgi:hypothetical protein
VAGIGLSGQLAETVDGDAGELAGAPVELSEHAAAVRALTAASAIRDILADCMEWLLSVG